MAKKRHIPEANGEAPHFRRIEQGFAVGDIYVRYVPCCQVVAIDVPAGEGDYTWKYYDEGRVCPVFQTL